VKYLSSRLKLALKPETEQLIKHFFVLFLLIYLAAALCYGLAGHLLDYQQGLIASEMLAHGLKAGFGLLCIGVLVIESM
jgi:hypothetical protein